MTLVFRSPKLVETISNQNPGPGAYKVADKVNKNIHPSANFISRVEKSNKCMEESELGPATYFQDSTTNESKQEKNLSVFKSKIERFGKDASSNNQLSKQKQFAKQFNELMKKEKNEHSYKGKLIDLKLKKEKQGKLHDSQNLPSIPGIEHSFGYRVDENTNKLVNNYNPKIIFTQTLKTTQKEDYYFQRSPNSLGNSKKCLINTYQKRNPNQLTHQLSNPSLNAYNADKYFTIQDQNRKVKKSTNFQSNLTRFADNSPSKKELLKLNKIKKDFQMYIGNEAIDLNSLEKIKHQSKSPEKSSPKKFEKNQLECFLSKQDRFQKEAKPPITQNFKKDEIKLITKQHESLPKNRESVTSQEKKKQPFDKGGQRFKPRFKEVLGPGAYQLKQQTFLHGVCLKQNQQRFKTHNIQGSMPGPGSYDFHQDLEQKQRVKVAFNKYRNNAYFNDIKLHQGKQHSMEDLYQQVGKHMNYLNKIEKFESKKKQNKHQIHRKSDSYLNLDRISQAKKILKEKLALGNEERDQKQNRVRQALKNPKYEHLYQYVKPEEKVSDVGPGYYEIRTTLDKKTFNKTVKE